MAYRLALSQWARLDECLKQKGVTYYFYPMRNDGFIYLTSNPEGLTKFHIHSIEHVDDDYMVFEKLLAKSSNWRGGAEPDLATAEIADWQTKCTGMDSTVLLAVSFLADCFRELGAVKQ